MNHTVFTLTLRQFLGQRRSLILFLLAFVPIIIAIVYRLGEHAQQHQETADFLADIVFTTVLPLACLILGTSAIGSEVEDGTAVYLLSKPIPRREIILAKFGAAALIAAMVVVPATAISALIGLSGVSEQGIAIGFSVAALVGVAAYTGLFVLLSVVTGRALLIGLAYAFIWEGVAASLFEGIKYFSIRQYCLGIADLISSARPQDFEANLGGTEGALLAAIVTAAVLYLAVRRLQSFELTSTD